MKETLERLVELQQADKDLLATEQTLEELGRGTTSAMKSLDAAKAAAAEAHRATQEAAAATHRHEMDLNQKEQEIGKTTVALNQAKSNKEYQSLLLQIGTLKAECGKIEEKILLAMDAHEAVAAKEVEAKKAVAAAEGIVRQAEARVDAERGDLEVRLGEQKAVRDAIFAQIPVEQQRLYERIRGGNRSSGTAVCTVRGMYCQGCQMEIMPQQYSELMSGNRIVLCRTCQRILVLDD